MTPAEELKGEKIKEAVEKISKIDILTFFEATNRMMKAYADLAKRIGHIQKENQEAFETMSYLGSIAPQMVRMLAERAPPEEFGAFIKAFMELLEIAPKLDSLMSLSAEEKIKVGEKLESIANTFEEMIKRTKEIEKEKAKEKDV
jgi:hypothetical protein